MLRALSIRHFAIIDSLELEFDSGFTAITGETGAGKSILIDALGLLLGERADSSLIAADQDQAELSARFELPSASDAGVWLENQAMNDGGELIIRRVLSVQGSSRAWINGRSATIGQLAELGALLVEIHGQHEHQRLERSETQRRLLDQQVDPALVQNVEKAHADWLSARQALADFETDAGDPDQLELLRFQVRELEDLGLADNEFEQLEVEQERLSRDDEIHAGTARAANALDCDDGPGVRGLLREALTALGTIRDLDPQLAAIAQMLEEARINIDEAISELDRFSDREAQDPQRLDQINRRLERSLDLARKHHVRPPELPELSVKFRARLDQLDNQDEQRRQLNDQVRATSEQWRDAAGHLSRARREAAGKLEKVVGQHLAELGMTEARLQFSLSANSQAEPSRHGLDQVTIEFSANPGQPLKPLSKVASGGELSRISLALMIALRPVRGPMVRVFDEVDAGVGGETAQVVGRFLRQAAVGGQAFCVTHLAQVAVCADHQFKVEKQTRASITGVSISRLDANTRQTEIARMLGNAGSRKSQEHAAEMLKSASAA
jgi:DNA repair protein RecN (Recombination protein N)